MKEESYESAVAVLFYFSPDFRMLYLLKGLDIRWAFFFYLVHLNAQYYKLTG